jgi:tetratricopeptide (TPR) repeat protein
MKRIFLLFLGLFWVANASAQTAEEWFAQGKKERNAQKALLYFTKAIEKGYKPLGEAYLQRGECQEALKRHKAALADFNKAIELSPKSAKLHFNRASTQANLKQLFAAILDLDTCIALDP